MSMLSYHFYTSALVSILVETKPDLTIKNKDDLMNSNIPIAFLNSGPIQNFINVRRKDNISIDIYSLVFLLLDNN